MALFRDDVVLLWWSMAGSAVAFCTCGFVLKEHKLDGMAPLVREPPWAISTPLKSPPPCQLSTLRHCNF